MKKTSTLIASLSMSLLTVGAMAQAPVGFTPKQAPVKFHPVIKEVMSSSHTGKAKKVSSSSIGGLLDYFDGDANNNSYTFWNGSTGNYTEWSPVLYMNAKYDLADTVTSPLSSASANQYTANSCTVVYDTMWDNDAFINTTTGFQSPIQAGSVNIDTIWTQVGYHNTSGQNDTLVLTICGVTKEGFPAASPVYDVETEIIPPHSTALPGTSLDSNFFLGWVPASPVNIPSSAFGGWHFCITATVMGSKMDTLGITYYSAFTQCSGSAYSDSVTTMGPANGAAPHSNSFINGLYWFNSKDFGGNGASEQFPLTSGAKQGDWVNTGGQQFFGFTPGGCAGFIWYPYVQNITIMASVDYNLSTGINNVAASGLSVGQNFPNPFNKTTQINYTLTKSSDVTFSVYDMTGRVLVNNVYTNSGAGQHTITLSANSFSPGVYFYTFNVNGSKTTNKMVITE
jgi:hypothetical protein